MSFRSFLKECVMRFFIIATCVGIASALVGPVLMPGKVLDFSAFFSPPIAALLGTLPSFVLYSRKELTLKQTIARKVLHLLMLEALLTVIAWLYQNVSTLGETLLFMAMVLVIYIAVVLISLWLQSKDARQINEGLKALQNQK